MRRLILILLNSKLFESDELKMVSCRGHRESCRVVIDDFLETIKE